MSPTSRATPSFVARTRAAAPVRGRQADKGRRTSIPLASSRLDLAARLGLCQRELRRRLERRDVFVDVVRGANRTLEPSEIAVFIVDCAATWVPAPSWVLVSSDLGGQL